MHCWLILRKERKVRMDTKSHLIFGKEICRYFDWSEDYASWALAPDIDTAFLHRYWRHHFAAIKELYKEYPKVNHGVPIENRKAIGTLILSHFYLDIFNAPIFCWGRMVTSKPYSSRNDG